MSFFKKLTAELKELMSDDKDKQKKTETKPDAGSYDPSRNDHQTQQYGAPTQQYNQSQQPQSQSQYGNVPLQQHGYGGAPGMPPQLPPGWIQQWDQNSQRWYYVEQATGRTQWEPLSSERGYPPQPHQQQYGAPAMQNYNAAYPQQGQYQPNPHADKKSSGKGGMVAAGAGGLVLGGLAGAALSGDSSDDESHARTAPYGAPQQGYNSTYGAPPPTSLENNPNLSSSQRSSLEEAREDYEKAQREVAEDSDPSSSDLEDLAEAREEYHSEVESAHSELED